MIFAELDLKPLFPTPFIIASLPPELSADLNGQLVPKLLKMSESMESAQITNVGGWQSNTRIMEWGGEPVRIIVNALREIIRQNTLDLHKPGFASDIDWQVYGWAHSTLH